MNKTELLAQKVKAASSDIMLASSETKNAVLLNIADALIRNTDKIIEENKKDIINAKDSGINETMIDRLLIDEQRVVAMANGIKQVIELPDPIGKILQGKTLPNNLKLQKVTVPLGVIGMIYESRPNVTVDAAVLCLKASNAVILRGGKEAINTNKILATIMQQAIADTGLDPFIIGLIEDTTRESAHQLMRLNQFLDVLIPRGSASLIQTVIQNATVPVIETGIGNCHIYVEETADLQKAVDIVDNAKTSRPSVCNACESLLVDECIAEDFLPIVAKRLWEKNVTIVGCNQSIDILGSQVKLATNEDYFTEFLDYKISIKVVKGIKEAVEHINHYSSHHSEAIITERLQQATYFVDTVDAAAVYVNASTRFTDGEEFGFGAEIGISTQKLHARGPMGLEELTTTKYIIYGDGQIR